MIHLRNFVALNLLIFTSTIRAAPPAIDASLASGGSQLDLHWKSVPGQIQQIQVSSDLSNWTNLPPVFASAFNDSAWSDDGSLTGSLFHPQDRRFYRLLLPQTLSASVGVPLVFLPGSTGFGYSWNFGDGTTSAADNPSHTCQSDGLYTITSVVIRWHRQGFHFFWKWKSRSDKMGRKRVMEVLCSHEDRPYQ